MIVEHHDDVVELHISLAIQEITAGLDLSGKHGAILLGKLLTPDVHDFFESQFATAEQSSVGGPIHVGIGYVVDDEVELGSTYFEFGKKSGLAVGGIVMSGKLDSLEAADGFFF